METITYELYSHWASALINGDRSGLDDEDEKELDAFLETVPEGYDIIECSGEEYFCHSPDCGGLAGTVLEYTFTKIES
jgi:hypothetical protein